MLTEIPFQVHCRGAKGLLRPLLHQKKDFYEKSQKKIQIKGKMPLSVHFFRDAEADALNMERCQLDKATLIACAVKRLREDLGNVPDSGKKPSA